MMSWQGIEGSRDKSLIECFEVTLSVRKKATGSEA